MPNARSSKRRRRPLATSTDSVATPGWVEVHGDLYHGIPCRIRVRSAQHDTALAGWRILERIDGVFNVHRDDSELGQLNALGPGAHAVSPWLAECLATARQVEALSDGAWCATMLPLVRLWRNAVRAGREPDETAIDHARAGCAADAWHLAGEQVHILRPGVAFDLGGLAKGYAVDLVVALMRQHGVDDFLIQVGGETACHGRSASGGPHRLGVPHPDDADGSWCAVLADPGTGLSGSTSGDYRQGHVIGAQTRHHIIDPRCGRSVDTGVASATCVFRGLGRNALADGLSTAVTVLGAAALPRLAALSGSAGSVLRRAGDGGLRESATPDWSTLLVDG